MAEANEVDHRVLHGLMHLLATDTAGIHRAFVNIRGLLQVNDFDANAVWDNLYLLIARAGTVSKVFWPPGSKATTQRRAEAMRELFNMTDGSPFAERGVRNSFEHIDERMHGWVPRMGDSSEPADLFIGTSAGLSAVKDRHFLLRAFDWEMAALAIGDDSVEIRPLMRENLRVHQRLCQIAPVSPAPLSTGLWWSSRPDVE